MAVFSEIWDTREGFMDEYFAQLSAVEAERERENHAAVQIQRLFRGFRTRKQIKKLQYVSDAGELATGVEFVAVTAECTAVNVIVDS